MIGLQYAILMRSELLELSFEQLGFLVGNGFLIENENIGNVIGVDLFSLVRCT